MTRLQEISTLGWLVLQAILSSGATRNLNVSIVSHNFWYKHKAVLCGIWGICLKCDPGFINHKETWVKRTPSKQCFWISAFGVQFLVRHSALCNISLEKTKCVCASIYKARIICLLTVMNVFIITKFHAHIFANINIVYTLEGNSS